MFHEDILKMYLPLIYQILKCIAKDFIWTTLKAIFSIVLFLHPHIPDSQIAVSQPNIALS